MTDTGRLIDQLAARVEPVRPLASPLRRTLAWSALATVLIGMIVWVYGVRDGLAAIVQEIWGSLPTSASGSASALKRKL